MSKVEISLPGIGAVRLRTAQTTIYIDAFTELVKPARVGKADLILVTHGDGDHFEPRETARAALKTGAVIVGPPGIAYPLLAGTSLPAEQLRIIYPVHFKKPVRQELSGVKLKVYQTKHFNDWEPDHISYLIELDGRKFYVTGDSTMLDETDPDLKGLDGIFYNLVMDFSTSEAIAAQVAVLEAVQQSFTPRYIFPNHLLHCEWTIDPGILQKAISQKGLAGIVVIKDENVNIEIA